MAESKITIDQLTETTRVEVTDHLLISRGGVYYRIKPFYLQGGLIKVTRTLTSAEILSGASIVLMEAQGAQTFIEPIDVGMTLQFNSAAYATATHFRVHHQGQTNYRMKTSTSFIQSASNRTEGMLADNGAVANYQLFSNTALVISPNATPIDGNSPVLVSAILRVTLF
jgi:hypothetical protein